MLLLAFGRIWWQYPTQTGNDQRQVQSSLGQVRDWSELDQAGTCHMMKLQSSGVLESFRSGFIKSGIDKSWHAWGGQPTNDWTVRASARRASLRCVDSGIPRVHRLLTRTAIVTLSMVAGMSDHFTRGLWPNQFRLLGLTVMSSGNVLVANNRSDCSTLPY